MIAESEMLKWGALGFVAFVVLVVIVPMVRAFVGEMKHSREERERMYGDFCSFVKNDAEHHRAALQSVNVTLERLCERVGRLPCTEDVEPNGEKELAG